ncbi:MAG: imidazole glycerol phosphate synthase subunit HisH [Flavobacteriales bacterium]|jgi:glutamine amidotransferase|nr:imidazole glycerol phosphate synthase subunit HisH [Flavobacteriales bacterium]|tara:strand:- start:3269 stop:3850 length:582 start_codon:yes stop_codon:yes gene_type:complete
MRIALIDYGAGNVQSVKYAIKRLGFEPILTKDHDVIRDADKVIFPGVGAAKSAMEQLIDSGLDKLIPSLKQPVLGICVGMQLMCNYSEEGDVECLGIIDAEVKKFREGLKIPHMGWNNISDFKSKIFDGLLEGEQFYFVHSFYVPENKYSVALTNYGIRFSAAIQKDNFYAVQFHTEKSGDAGEQILKQFLEL